MLNIVSSSERVSGKTHTLIEMLDAYASSLENTGVSLKNMAAALEQIKDHAGSLIKETDRLTEEDAALKKIATHTIVTAQTEYLKFQRGDYLS